MAGFSDGQEVTFIHTEASDADVAQRLTGMVSGLQADVFDSAPTDPGYSPLRSMNLVSWTPGADPRELTSAEEVKAAAEVGSSRSSNPVWWRTCHS